MPARILVTSRSFGSTSQVPAQILAGAGCEIVKPPPGIKLVPSVLIDAVQSADGWIVGNEPVTAEVLHAAPRLRAVVKHGTGVDNIDLAAAQARGILIANTPGANAPAVAELAVALLLAAARQLVFADHQAHAGSWKPVVGTNVRGKTLGIIGLGRIGKQVVELLRGYELKVLAYDTLRDDDFARAHGVQYSALEQLLRASDFISLHAPLLPETHHLIGAMQLGWMKPTALLVNTARGELVDERALHDALRERRIAGAALDVIAQEPPNDSLLLRLENVIITPHIGAHTTDAITAVSVRAAENLVAALQGRAVPDRVI